MRGNATVCVQVGGLWWLVVLWWVGVVGGDWWVGVVGGDWWVGGWGG